MGYTKLFSSIVASTIWREDAATRLVWITMLALKNERHEVEASIPGLADLARVKLEDCEKALRKLESKDEYSRNQNHDGRRIQKVEGGWLILNGEYYRQKMSIEERREYQRVKQAEYRKKNPKPKRSKPDKGSIVAANMEEHGATPEQIAHHIDDVNAEALGGQI